MTFRTNLAVATLLAAGTLTLSSPPAMAQIVCDEWGECWQVHRHYGYGSEWMHPYWRWGEERHHGWREQEGLWLLAWRARTWLARRRRAALTPPSEVVVDDLTAKAGWRMEGMA
jgi:hypothetical protein